MMYTSDFLLKMLQKSWEDVLPSPMPLHVQADQISRPVYIVRHEPLAAAKTAVNQSSCAGGVDPPTSL